VTLDLSPGTCRIETSTDLKTWAPLMVLTPSAGETSFLGTQLSGKQKFYRPFQMQ
jgi:hypothetical protein